MSLSTQGMKAMCYGSYLLLVALLFSRRCRAIVSSVSISIWSFAWAQMKFSHNYSKIQSFLRLNQKHFHASFVREHLKMSNTSLMRLRNQNNQSNLFVGQNTVALFFLRLLVRNLQEMQPFSQLLRRWPQIQCMQEGSAHLQLSKVPPSTIVMKSFSHLTNALVDDKITISMYEIGYPHAQQVPKPVPSTWTM